MKYYLTRMVGIDSICDNLEITETEYNTFCREVRKSRADEAIQSIKRLCDVIGTEETKSMIRATLREI